MKKELVQRENEIIIHQNVARLRGRLTTVESRSMLSILKRANESVALNPDIKDFKISINAFLDDITVGKETRSVSAIVHDVSKHLEQLMTKIFEWGTTEKLSKAIFIQQIEITKKEVTFRFSDYIREHIKPISNALIIKDFELLQSFRSEYARQLYKHLMSWEKQQSLYLSLKDLKDFLGVPATKSYERMDVLKRKAINVAVDEINEKCPYLDLKYINITQKRSKTIEGFEFSWFNEQVTPKKKQKGKSTTVDFSNFYGINCKIKNKIREHLLVIIPLDDGSINCSFRSGESYHFDSLQDLLVFKI